MCLALGNAGRIILVKKMVVSTRFRVKGLEFKV